MEMPAKTKKEKIQNMADSILLSVKKILLIADEDTGFDDQIIMYTNSVFDILTQLGVGPKEGYAISGNTEIWSDYLGDNKLLNLVKTYIPLKVKLMWDNNNGTVNNAISDIVAEKEWRINVMVDPGLEDIEE